MSGCHTPVAIDRLHCLGSRAHLAARRHPCCDAQQTGVKLGADYIAYARQAMLVLCAGALAQARGRAQGSCAPPPARGQQPRLRRTAGPDAAHAHRRFRAAGPRASFVTPVCKNLQGCRGHWLARAARAQGCRARALACARARAQGGTHVGGTRASARARAHPCAS